MSIGDTKTKCFLQQHNYKLLKKVGVGNYGHAFLIESMVSKDQLRYVCKVVDLQNATTSAATQASGEAQLLSSLQDFAIVKYCESFISHNRLGIIMEYCDGGDFSSKIKRM